MLHLPDVFSAFINADLHQVSTSIALGGSGSLLKGQIKLGELNSLCLLNILPRNQIPRFPFQGISQALDKSEKKQVMGIHF